jgi:hypothetical protein
MYENLTNPGAIGLGAMQAFQQGRDMRTKDDTRKAFTAYATDPNDTNLNGLAQFDPQFVMQAKQQQAQAARQQQQDMQQQQEQARQKMGMVARLLDGVQDEGTYQQGLAAAQQMGLDVSQAPPQYDPNWVGQQRMIASLFEKGNEQQLSGIARELTDAGYKPGTPEFNEAMKGVIQNKYASEYVDGRGATRRRSALQLEGGPQPPPPNEAIAELRANPGSAAQFDEIFGQGASARILGNGGQTQPASSTFRQTVPNGRSVIGDLFPGARVTSGYRGPNHALSRANPSSWHARSRGAVDVAPIKGMTFDQYVSRIRGAGYQIIEARDEVSNPSKHATGPHWHVVIGDRK